MYYSAKHKHVKIPTVAKIFLVFELPFQVFTAHVGKTRNWASAEKLGIPSANWIFQTRTASCVASVIGVVCGYFADSRVGRYWMCLVLLLLSTVSPIMTLFCYGIMDHSKEQYKTAAKVFLQSLVSYQIVEPVRTALIFDQVPRQVENHHLYHYFLFFIEIKSLASIISLTLNAFFKYFIYLIYGVALALVLTYDVFIIVVRRYITNHASHRIVRNTVMCIITALKKLKIEGRTKPHWLDHAVPEFENEQIRTTKQVTSMIFIFSSMTLYGIVTQLIKETWVEQNARLIEDQKLKAWYLEILTFHYLLTLVCVPFIEYGVLPLWERFRKAYKHVPKLTELRRIGISVFLTGFSLVGTLMLQLEIEKHSTILPNFGQAQLRVFNSDLDTILLTPHWVTRTISLKPAGMLTALNIETNEKTIVKLSVFSASAQTNRTASLEVFEGESVTYFTNRNETYRIKGFDPLISGPTGTNDADDVRCFLINPYRQTTDFSALVLKNKKGKEYRFDIPGPRASLVFVIKPDTYSVTCDRQTSGFNCTSYNYSFRFAGKYAIFPFQGQNNRITVEIHNVVKPGDMSIYNMLPAIILQSLSEACGKIPIQVFLYKESPEKLKATIIAVYLLTRDGATVIIEIYARSVKFGIDTILLVICSGIYFIFFVFYLLATMKHMHFEGGIKRRGSNTS